jgi:hypothetical protein
MHMGLYIRDDGVNELADRLAAATGQTKTQAVREALEARLRTLRSPATIRARIAAIQERMRAGGVVADGASDKEFMDELSGGL